MRRRDRKTRSEASAKKFEKKARKIADRWGGQVGPRDSSEIRDRNCDEKRDGHSDARGEDMEEQYPPDILDVQDDFLFGSSSEDDCTLYYYQVQKLFPVTGSPPYVVQAGTSAIQAVLFPLPNKKKLQANFIQPELRELLHP